MDIRMKSLDFETLQSDIPRSILLGNRKQSAFESREEMISDALHTVAGFIAELGDEYLPIFDRLECALEDEKRKQATLNRARILAKRN